MQTLDDLVLRFLDDPRNVLALAAAAFLLVVVVVYFALVRLVFKSLLRNLLRTTLTAEEQSRRVPAGVSPRPWWLYSVLVALTLALAEWWTWQRRITV